MVRIFTPNATDILASVASVKLCVPLSQRDTSASECPIMWANSLCFMPLFFKVASILSAMANDISSCFFNSGEASATIWSNNFLAVFACFIYQFRFSLQR